MIKKLRLNLWIIRENLSSGLPDFFMYRKERECFVEVKLEHEQLKPHQKDCMKILEKFQFDCYVYRVKSKPYKIRKEINLQTNEETVIEKQLKLKKRYSPKINI